MSASRAVTYHAGPGPRLAGQPGRANVSAPQVRATTVTSRIPAQTAWSSEPGQAAQVGALEYRGDQVAADRPFGRARPAALLCLFVSGLGLVPGAGCESEPPQPIGRLRRPSGLALLERSPSRSDLFIADSEAQGVRVLQYQRAADGSLSSAFLPGPVVFFPLVLSAPGFPTRLATARARGSRPDEGPLSRLYALAPAVSSLYVMSVGEVAFRGRSIGTDDNVTVGRVDLAAVTANHGTPVDLASLGSPSASSGSDGDADIVVVALDGLGASDGSLVALRLPADGLESLVDNAPGREIPTYGGARAVGSATVAASPRAVLVRSNPSSPGTGWILVSSAGAQWVSMVPFDLSLPEVLLPGRRLDAGGETGEFVDLGDRGVLALRIDRSAAVWFESEPVSGELRRSTSLLPSPYTIPRERGREDAAGRLDLGPDAYSVAGALGRISVLNETNRGPNLLAQVGPEGPPYDVVMLVRSDGSAGFLAGNPMRPLVSTNAELARVSALPGSGGVRIQECEEPAFDLCDSGPATTPRCAPGILVSPRSQSQLLRASLQGPLHRSGSGRVVALAPVGASTVSAAGRYALTDERLVDFGPDGARVTPGDFVLLQGVLGCPEGPTPFIETGTVTAVVADLRGPESHAIASSLTFVVGGGLAESAVGSCSFDAAVMYDVYPSRAEVVLEPLQEGLGREAVSRFPVEAREGGGFHALIDAEVRLTLELPGPLSCALSDEVPCFLDGDCGPGRRCLIPASGCGGRCSDTCDAGLEATCVPRLLARQCPGVELLVTPSVVHQIDLSQDARVKLAAPESLLFSDLLGGWVGSFPGTRALLEIRPLTEEEALRERVQSIPFGRSLQR